MFKEAKLVYRNESPSSRPDREMDSRLARRANRSEDRLERAEENYQEDIVRIRDTQARRDRRRGVNNPDGDLDTDLQRRADRAERRLLDRTNDHEERLLRYGNIQEERDARVGIAREVEETQVTEATRTELETVRPTTVPGNRIPNRPTTTNPETIGTTRTPEIQNEINKIQQLIQDVETLIHANLGTAELLQNLERAKEKILINIELIGSEPERQVIRDLLNRDLTDPTKFKNNIERALSYFRNRLRVLEQNPIESSQTGSSTDSAQESGPNGPTNTPEQNQSREVIRTYRAAVDRSLNGIFGGIVNFLGVSNERLAIHFAAEGTDPAEIGFMGVMAAAFSITFNGLFNRDAIRDASDIPLDQNGQRITFRDMDNADWENLTNEATEVDSVHTFNNLRASSGALEINETHEILIPAGTKIQNIEGTLQAVTVNNPRAVTIEEGEEFVATQDIVIRSSYTTAEGTEENILNNGIRFIGPITYRPTQGRINAPVESDEQREIQSARNSLETASVRRLSRERENRPEAFEIANEASVDTINLNLSMDPRGNDWLSYIAQGLLNSNDRRPYQMLGEGLGDVTGLGDWINKVNLEDQLLVDIRETLNTNGTILTGLDASQLTDPVKDLLAQEIALSIISAYVPQFAQNDELNSRRNIRVRLEKNDLTSRTDNRLMYNVTSLDTTR